MMNELIMVMLNDDDAMDEGDDDHDYDYDHDHDDGGRLPDLIALRIYIDE